MYMRELCESVKYVWENSVIAQAGMPMRKNKTTCVLCQNIQTTIVTRVFMSLGKVKKYYQVVGTFVRDIEKCKV